jgi:hypothetical protein
MATTQDHMPDTPAGDPAAARVEEIYDALGGRLTAAKRSYLRLRVAWLFALPLLLGVSAAFAASGSSPQTSQVAGRTEIGTPPPDAPFVDLAPKPIEGRSTLAAAGDKLAKVTDWQRVELGSFGAVEIGHYGEALMLGEKDLADGWTVKVFRNTAEELILAVSGGGENFAVYVRPVSSGYTVEIEALIAPTPTPEPTKEPTPTPTKKPAPEVETRKVISVFDIGKVVVERDGDQLWLGIKSAVDGFTATVLKEHGTKVEAIFVSDTWEKHVKAWIDGPYIRYDTWYVEVAPAFQTRKEISVYGHGTVVVERIGDSANLVLDVTWAEAGFTPTVITETGPVVEAVLVSDAWEKHVRAWTDGPSIGYELWAVEVAPAPYDGVVDCDFGSMTVHVEGAVASITSVTPADGVTATITKASGEFVSVQYDNGVEVWLVKAWGNGTEVVSEAIQIS